MKWSVVGRFCALVVVIFMSHLISCTSKDKVETTVAGDPWFRAARTADIEVMKKMVAEGKEVDSTSEVGVTALLVASRMGNLQTMKWLLENGANAKHLDHDRQSALSYALTGLATGPKQVQAVELLLKHGADPFVVDVIGFVPVMEMLALEMDGPLKMLSYSEKRQCDRMPKVKGEMTLSQAARKMNRIDLAEFFEKQGCW
ncbi:MAG: ankyrin repeat domain-containing protein [Deltaproteobacteria bacterium]|jgi:hypothetical protein|nr:ankyrin repeat domain-containing protein [Deltaproteobacteria bacterium]